MICKENIKDEESMFLFAYNRSCHISETALFACFFIQLIAYLSCFPLTYFKVLLKYVKEKKRKTFQKM